MTKLVGALVAAAVACGASNAMAAATEIAGHIAKFHMVVQWTDPDAYAWSGTTDSCTAPVPCSVTFSLPPSICQCSANVPFGGFAYPYVKGTWGGSRYATGAITYGSDTITFPLRMDWTSPSGTSFGHLASPAGAGVIASAASIGSLTSGAVVVTGPVVIQDNAITGSLTFGQAVVT